MITRIKFEVSGPIPETDMPYKIVRGGRPIVTRDTRKFRARIEEAFLKAGGRRPVDGEVVRVFAHYYVTETHADLDSAYHSIQDGLS